MAVPQDTPPSVADHPQPVTIPSPAPPCQGHTSVAELNRVIARTLEACESRALDSAADRVAVTMTLSQAIGRWLERMGLVVS